MKMARLWKTLDGRIVPDGDPEAAFLACAEGEDLTDAELDRRGLKGYHGLVEDKAVRLEEGETKAPTPGVIYPPETTRGPGGKFVRKP